jgi:hypothetical protein
MLGNLDIERFIDACRVEIETKGSTKLSPE